MRIVYDSTNIYDDPAGAHMVAYYCDGIYAVSEATVRARFPTAILIAISAIGTNAGVVGDVEPGCMSIGYAIQWVEWRRAAGVDPTIYINEMNGWAGGVAAFKAAGVAQPHWWVADYDNIAAVPAGAVAKQYANPPLTHGHFDMSVALDSWPGVDTTGDTMTPERETLLFQELAQVQSLLEGRGDAFPSIDGKPAGGGATRAAFATRQDLVDALKSIPPATVDTAAIAAAVVALLPTSNKPPAPPQAVKDWWAALMKYLGWA